jgi:DNA mismatch repair protein MutS
MKSTVYITKKGIDALKFDIKANHDKLKAKYPKHVLLFRVGDFYESFYDDAKAISKALTLTLTTTAKGENGIPMCGFMAHIAEHHIANLLRAGFHVHVCEDWRNVK